jgi:hypothetical protein
MASEVTPPPDYLNDIRVERRLTALETQMAQVQSYFAEIKVEISKVAIAGSQQQTSNANIENRIKELETDVERLSKKLDGLDTLSFFSKNPKLAFWAILGFLLVMSPQLRGMIAQVLLSTTP